MVVCCWCRKGGMTSMRWRNRRPPALMSCLEAMRWWIRWAMGQRNLRAAFPMPSWMRCVICMAWLAIAVGQTNHRYARDGPRRSRSQRTSEEITMLRDLALTVRELSVSDLPTVRRLMNTSEYLYARFGSEELPRLLARRPGVAAFSGPSLQAFLLANLLAPPSAWIGGFGVVWGEGHRFARYLDLLLPPFIAAVRRMGAESLYYTGGDLSSDWLKETLLGRQFHLLTTLRSYDKEDFGMPTRGNQDVLVRPFQRGDLSQLLEVEAACFEQYWRYDSPGFLEIAETY